MKKISKFIIIGIIGYWFADFSSGLLHIYMDHIKIDLNKNTRSGWEHIAYSFQYSHHIDPHEIIKSSNIFLNPSGQELLWLFWILDQIILFTLKKYFKFSLSTMYMICISFEFLALNLWTKCLLTSIGIYGFPVLVTFIASILLKGCDVSLNTFMQTYLFFGKTSQINHCLAHMVTRHLQGKPINHIIEPNYKILKFLQGCHLLLRPEDHCIHHEKKNVNFAIVNGWSNGVLNILFYYIISPLMKRYPEIFVLQ